MNIPRRTVLATALALPWAARAAGPGGTETVKTRLRPGQPPLTVRVTAEDLLSRLVRIRATGPGAPAGEVVLASRYGGIAPLRPVRMRGRDVAVALLTGLSGTCEDLATLTGRLAAGPGDGLHLGCAYKRTRGPRRVRPSPPRRRCRPRQHRRAAGPAHDGPAGLRLGEDGPLRTGPDAHRLTGCIL